MPVDSIPQQAQEKIEQIESADVVVGILADLDHPDIVSLCESLQKLAGSPRLAVLRNEKGGNAPPPDSELAEMRAFPFLVSWPLLQPDAAGAPILNLFAAFQAVYAASEKLGARACCIVVSKLENASAGWISELAKPLLERNIDLVLPRYAPHKLEGLLNFGVISPLMRSLYGKRIQNPMGPDLGVSQRLFRKMLVAEGKAKLKAAHPLASLVPEAASENLQVCEVHVGARIYPPTDWTNISSRIAQVLGPVFLDIERNAVFWQRMRGSVPVPSIGEPGLVPQDPGPLEIGRMIESFQLGNRDLQEIWGFVLPPSTLFELRKLSRLAADQFHMPDELWARIVYDFALAHRLRAISRDHLLKSMTPLYLAWVASYAQDIKKDGDLTVDQRLESLSVAYESCKSYFVARWRWPDRFNS